MASRVLLTRSYTQSQAFAAECPVRDICFLIDPLVDVIFRMPDLCGYIVPDAIVASSANAFSGDYPESWRHVPVYAVGAQTSASAERCGFINIITGPGHMAALVPILQDVKGVIYYLRGQDVRHDLKNVLPDIQEFVVYETILRPELSAQTLESFKNSSLNAVAVFSQKSAEALCGAIHLAGLEQYCKGIYCLCLDESMVKSCRDLNWKDIRVSQQPDRTGMYDLLRNL